MDKSQYTLPTSEFNDAPAPQQSESFQRTPEKIQHGPFEIVQLSARTMNDRRDTAVAIELKNGRNVTIPGLNIKLNLPPRAPEAIYKKLIEQERAIGGSIFENGEQGNYGFWLDQKGQSFVSEDVSDWHLEIPNPSDPKNPYGVHIEATAWELRKFHKDGKPYAMTIQDIERFIPAVYHYVKETAQLYPFDQDFDDIVHAVDMPANVVAMLPLKDRGTPNIEEPLAP